MVSILSISAVFRLNFITVLTVGYVCLLFTIENRHISMKSLKIPKGGNQKPYIKEEQTKEKVQKDKQRSTKLTYKTKDRNLYIFLPLFGDSSF
jgi:uncharacterized protein YxeA